MFFELRQYRILNGQMERWVRLMEEKIIPFNVSKGIIVTGSFVGQEEKDLYVWIRRFESEEAREQQYRDVYESEYWKNVIKPETDEMLDRKSMLVTRLEATSKSVIR
jgi:hypothetical protein